MRIALGLEYRGTEYCGWQTQPAGCAIQDRLERALGKFLGEPASTVCAGRTDTGVHAVAQVVHLDTNIVRDNISWVRGTNASLPADIRVVWAKPVHEDFHARFSATSRTYRYILLNDPVGSATLAGLVGWFHVPLDIAAMQAAAALLRGEHDFSAYRAAECQAKSPVRTITNMHVEALRDGANGGEDSRLLVFSLTANAFLHHMVRNIVGALIYVGAGRHSLAEFCEIFAGRDRTCAAPTFASDGLYLSAIEYDARFGLPAFRSRHPFGV